MGGSNGPVDGPELAFEVERDVHAPGSARDRAAAFMDAVGTPADVQRDVLVAVSELVTNAVTHAASAPLIRLAAADGRLRVEVHDASTTQPVQRQGSAAGGFGMRLIAELSTTWGWALTTGGKLVWAEFAVAAPTGTT